MVKCRPSAARRRVSSAVSGMNRAIASSTSRSSAAGPILCATGADVPVDVGRGLRGQARAGDDLSATRRAFHAGRSPEVTRFHSRGSR